MKYTMINGTRDGRYELICYRNGEAVSEQIFNTEADARYAANQWLNVK